MLHAVRARDPAVPLCEGLRALLGFGPEVPVALLASGREALRVAFEELARRSGRREVLVPAYTCYSVPAAAAAAGLRVRLVDVDSGGQLDPEALGRLPLERAAALVVCNLFGIAEPLGAVRELTAEAGIAIIDDAAQALGASGPDGPAGGRGDAGVLSFARGKPLSALGGGALVGPIGSARHESARRDGVARRFAGADLQPVAPPPCLSRRGEHPDARGWRDAF